MGKIFFSYRPTDSRLIAERIRDRLMANYGHNDVHLDIKAPAGGDVLPYFEDFLSNFSVLVAVIGPNWIDSRSRDGNRRIDDPHDSVRAEIEAALAKGIPIIPILVRGAAMPDAPALPDGIQSLATIQPLVFGGDENFRGDMMRLHRQLAQYIIGHDIRRTSASPIDAIPSPARKNLLNEAAAAHLAAGKPPFWGDRIDTLGEVLWILGAQSGALGKQFGERRFPPDLSGADLSNVNLSGADLSTGTFIGTRLVQANLSGANLIDAKLAKADLSEANLRDARLDHAVLHSAILELANFTSCSLENADLSDVHFTTTVLTNANLNGANLRQAKLIGIELPGVLLNDVDLTDADLTDAILPRAQLKGAHLEDTKLDGADLSGACLAGADLNGAKLNKTDLSAVDLTDATIGSVEALQHVIMDDNTRLHEVKWGGRPIKKPDRRTPRDQKLRAYRELAQNYHEIAEMLQNGGIVAKASTYRLEEQKMRRGVLFTTPRYGAWLFSSSLNVISGYGERISRTLATYLIVIFGFAFVYFIGTTIFGLGEAHLTLYQALIQSVVSFHGRGFVSSALQLRDPMAGVTVAESVAGLFIEAIFIATFSRRFLSD